jgi:hypothetical protein
MIYPYGDSRRALPCIETDLHSMAVLIYEYLLTRHPLNGPKHIPDVEAEEEDFLLMGPQAVFIEDPNDKSNRPDDLAVTIHDLGPYLEALFLKAFSTGLHAPKERPTAMEWEQGLLKTWNLLYPCENPGCSAKWFVMHDVHNPVCPFCGRRVSNNEIVKFTFNKELKGRPGQWVKNDELMVYNNIPLFQWHVFSNVFADEKADRELQAYVVKFNGEWLLINQRINSMRSASGNIVAPGKAIQLKDGMSFRIADEEDGYLVGVSIVK